MGLVQLRNLTGNGPASVDYSVALSTAARNRAATAILSYLASVNRPFDVVVLQPDLRLDYGQMLTNEDQSGPEVIKAREAYAVAFGYTQAQARTLEIPRPTVFWNPVYTFDYCADVRGCTVAADGAIVAKTMMQLQHGDFYYQYNAPAGQIKVPVVRFTRATMPPWVVLFHELGHVKQYYEGGGRGEWNTRLQAVDAIEADNLRDHENPICRDLQIPIREHYKHFPKQMATLINGYSASAQKAHALRISNDALARINEDRTLETEARANAQMEAQNNPRVGMSIPVPSSLNRVPTPPGPSLSSSMSIPMAPPLIKASTPPPLSPRGSMSIPMAPPFSKVPTPPSLGRVPSIGSAPPPPPPLSLNAIPITRPAEAIVGFFEKR